MVVTWVSPSIMLYFVYCPKCEDVYSTAKDLDSAKNMCWKHHWKSEDGHVKEEDMIIFEGKKVVLTSI